MRASKRRSMVATALVALGAAAGGVVALERPAGAVRPLATAVLRNAAGTEIGTVTFSGSGRNAERAEVELSLPADAPGLGRYHGFHIHTAGVCTAPFSSAGGHWTLTSGTTHGDHTGDLPSVLIGPDGRASAEFETHRFDVGQLFDADGSSIVLHEGPDNFGNVPLAANRYEDPTGHYGRAGGTAATGDAGGRYGCGVVRPA